MRMPLAAVTKYRNLLALEIIEICLIFVVDFCHCDPSVSLMNKYYTPPVFSRSDPCAALPFACARQTAVLRR